MFEDSNKVSTSIAHGYLVETYEWALQLGILIFCGFCHFPWNVSSSAQLQCRVLTLELLTELSPYAAARYLMRYGLLL